MKMGVWGLAPVKNVYRSRPLERQRTAFLKVRILITAITNFCMESRY